MKRRSVASAVALTVLLAALFQAQGGESCIVVSPETCPVSAQPQLFTDLDFIGIAELNLCAVTRCECITAITGGDVTTITQCENPVLLNNCNRLERCHNVFYNCVIAAVVSAQEAAPGTTIWATPVYNALVGYMRTPGFLFRDTPVFTSAAAHYCTNFLQPYNCDGITTESNACPASYDAVVGSITTFPSQAAVGSSGLEEPVVNVQICSTGCVTSIIVMSFYIVTAVAFLVCWGTWPSPQLKLKYAGK